MLYTIGDIHGKLEMLQLLLSHIESNSPFDGERDRVIFLGDYIDRGEDSKGVVSAVMAWKEKYPNTVCLRGNHEQFLLDAAEEEGPFIQKFPVGSVSAGPKFQIWHNNGGAETLQSYGTWEVKYLPSWRSTVVDHWDFFMDTLLEHEEPGMKFVHAGVLPQDGVWEHSAHKLDPRLWIRKEFLTSRDDFGALIVFGHTPQLIPPLPLVQKNKIGMDTGGVFGGRISLGIFDPDDLSEFQLVQVYTSTVDGSARLLEAKTVSIPKEW